MTTKGAILKAIREHCLSCCNGSPKEVELCNVGNNLTSTIGRCQLYPYRSGHDPAPSRKGRFQKSATTQRVILQNTSDMIVAHGQAAGEHE